MTPFRLLSANLWNLNADPAGFIRLIERVDADVVCMQELSPPTARLVEELLPFGELSPARNQFGMGIALQRPAKLGRIEMRHRSARTAVLDPDDWPELAAPLEIINIHLAAPDYRGPLRSLHHRSHQLADLEAYLEAEGDRPRLLVGDLNSTPLWPAYRRLRRRFADAASDVARAGGTRPARTWGPTPASRRLLRIDHALVADVEVAAVEVVEVPGSDHSGLVVDVAGVTAR